MNFIFIQAHENVINFVRYAVLFMKKKNSVGRRTAPPFESTEK